MLILWVNLNLPFDLHSNSMKYVLLTRILWPPDASFWLIGKHANAGKTEGRKRRGPQRMGWLNGITDAMDMNLGKLQEMVGDRDAWHTAIHGVMKGQTWLSDWTELMLASNIWIHFFRGIMSPKYNKTKQLLHLFSIIHPSTHPPTPLFIQTHIQT